MTARPAIGHIPFRGHRTQAEVREDEVRRLPWCPLEYRDTYAFLRDDKRLGATHAREATEDQIAADRRRGVV